MNGNDQYITDKELHRLLQLQMLGQDTPIAKQLIDMEAIIVFGSEAVIIPPAHKERELLQKLNGKKRSAWIKWWLPVIIIAITALSFLLLKEDKHASPASSSYQEAPASKSSSQQETTGNNNASPVISSNITPVDHENIDAHPSDSIPADNPFIYMNEMTNGNPVLAGNTKLKQKEDDYDYSNVPVLTQEQIDENNKYKEKMIKQVIKRDKDHWSLIPMSTIVYKGDTISVASFYISTTEVTNKQYRTFVHDLLAQGRVEDYLKAVPDTLQWAKHLASAEAMTNMYFWHPAFDEYPVVNISREGARMYCNWLTESVYKKLLEKYPEPKESSGNIYEHGFINDLRLPVEAEWVTAAQGGMPTPAYAWEGQFLRNKKGMFMANFKPPGKDNATSNWPEDGAMLSAPVTSYWPNKYGLYNMCGNVAEMVWKHGDKYTGNWRDLTSSTKGGSWNSDSEHIKIEGADEYEGISEGSPFIGFRPVMTYLMRTGSVKKEPAKTSEKDK